jgi:hypothetical protein
MTIGSGPTPFSAADAALGYLYQCRVALLEGLRRTRAGEDFLLRLETLDDVVFERQGDASILLQTKHHRRRAADLTDASKDLWKTLRVWSEGTADGTIPTDSFLYLMTTSSAPEGAAAGYLRAGQRDVAKALDRLLATARTSISKDNELAYESFLGLGDEERRGLIERVVLLDSAPAIVELDQALKAEIRWAVEREHLDSFLVRLEGWWLRRAIRVLSAPATDAVLSRELDAQVDELREQFKRDALPIDEDILAAQVDASEYADSVFVRQLHLIGVGAPRVLAAIREYFRAYAHRSQWMREDLLLVGEIDRYERQLVEEWDLVFQRMRDDLGADAAEEAKKEAAQGVYAWVESTTFPIRPNVTAAFVTRGSYQILADRLKVGWHPEFLTRLQHLLDAPGTTS